MAFELNNVVPWGRCLNEYIQMFKLSNFDLNKKIISFGDGPASFNSEMNIRNKQVVSLDPLYQFSKVEIKQRIEQTKETVMEQITINKDNFIWKNIKNIEELEKIRMNAMANFIEDYELGKNENRYCNHELPNITKYNNLEFEIGLSSHFLILYSQLGIDFHLKAITEMLRICKEIRIFPILNLNAKKSEVLNAIITHFDTNFIVTIRFSDYEFQKEGNEMLVIQHNF